MLNNKYGAESKKNLYQSKKTDEGIEILQLEADFLKDFTCRRIGRKESTSIVYNSV